MVQATIARFKVDDYHRMIDAGILDERKVELLEGVITEMAPQGTSHAYYSDESGDYLSELLGSRAKLEKPNQSLWVIAQSQSQTLLSCNR